MATGREHFALDWIKADLLETLNQARIALDEFAEDGGDETRMRACLTALHQVHGTLVMLELEGVAQLADHLEKLAQAMLAKAVPDMGSAGQALMQGILELPGFIEELQRGATDSASTSMPLVNEVRDLLELPKLEDPAGMSLNAGASDEVIARFEVMDGPQKVVRIRSAYQNVLLSILKGEDRGPAIETLKKIAIGLERVTEGSALERQWEAFGEFVASLGRYEGVLEPEAVKLLRRVDLEIKTLAKDGSKALRRPVNMELVQQLLDGSVDREHTSDALLGLQEAVSRDLEQNTLAISGRQALTSAAGALREELAAVKDRLDLLVRAQTVDLEELRQLITPLKQIGSTLSLLGFESSREIVSDQVDAIENLVVLGDGDPQGVQSIAGALVQIDENLGGVAQGSEASEVEQITSEAQLQVLLEARNSLELVKQAIVDFVSAGWDARHLEEAPAILDGVCGALEIVPLPPAIGMLKRIRGYIVDRLMQGHQPEWAQLDSFADVISATDYYLERLSEQSAAGADEILAIAERSMVEIEKEAPVSAAATEAEVPQAETELPQAGAATPELEPEPELTEPEATAEAANEDLAFEGDLEDVVPGGLVIEPEDETPALDDAPGASEEFVLELDEDADDVDAGELVFETADVEDTSPSIEAPVFGARDDADAADELALELEGDDADEVELDEDAPIEFEMVELEASEGEAEDADVGQDAIASTPADAYEEETDAVSFTTDTVVDADEAEDDLDGAIPYEPVAQSIGAEPEAELIDPENLPIDEEIELTREDDTAFDLSSDLYDSIDGAVTDAESAFAVEDTEVSDAPEEVQEEELAAAAEESAPAQETESDIELPDPEIVEIFVEEIGEVLENIDAALPEWAQTLEMGEPLTEVRRAFHTLKGSGRIVQAAAIGELAWGIENMLNRVIDGTVEPTQEFVRIITEARDMVPGLRDAFEQGDPGDLDKISAVLERADILASGGSLGLQEAVDEPVDGADAASEDSVEFDVNELEVDADEREDEPALVEEAEAQDEPLAASPESDEPVEVSSLPPELEPISQTSTTFDLFVQEAHEHLDVLVAENQRVPWQLSEPMVRALHTLAGSAAIAGLPQVQLVVEPSYQVAEAYRGLPSHKGVQEFIALACEHLKGCFDALGKNEPWEEPLEFVAAADDLLAAVGDQPRPIDAFLASDTIAQVLDGEAALAEFLDGERESCSDMLNALTGLVAESGEIGETHLGDLASALLQTLTNITIGGFVPEGGAQVVGEAYETLLGQLNGIAGGTSAGPQEAVLTSLLELDFDPQLKAGEEDLLSAADDAPVTDVPLDTPLEEAADAVQASEAASVEASAQPEPEQELEPEPEPGLEPEPVAAASEAAPQPNESIEDAFDIDPDLIDVFFEEAEEIGEELESNILGWSQEMDNRLYMENLLRGLHTLKGGARLCGLAALGDRVHDFESLVIEVQNDERIIDADLFTELHKRYDQITTDLADIQRRVEGGLTQAMEGSDESQATAAAAPEQALDATSSADEPVAPARVSVLDEGSSVSDVNKVLEAVTAPRDTANDLPENDLPAPQPPVEQQPVERNQEMVRVGSTLLEELVNLAGENSILRARIEQGMSDFTGALDEMETTIERLREQLRRLEIETETQVLYRHDSGDGPKYENFDPLEMDRYSQMQQLSRSLSESASDMLDLKDTLLFRARESETLLLQQARINTELQEGLMRTRMVPFNRLMPRLRRIVRQVSGELQKEVEFHAQNAEGELDRNLLERMVPPLEHMLRNAVDHGIESQEMRRNFGKPAAGRIDLRLSREGGDVVIEISRRRCGHRRRDRASKGDRTRADGARRQPFGRRDSPICVGRGLLHG